MRNVVACVLALSLLATASLAAETGALPQGAPAGINQAQKSGGISGIYVVAGALTLLGLGALLISSQSSASSTGIFFDSNDTNVIPVNNTNVISTTTTTG